MDGGGGGAGGLGGEGGEGGGGDNHVLHTDVEDLYPAVASRIHVPTYTTRMSWKRKGKIHSKYTVHEYSFTEV